MAAFTSETHIFLSMVFVTEIWRKGFDGIGDCFIGTSVGIEYSVIGRLAALGRLELNEGGAVGRLYVEGLASALAVHLLRSSRSSAAFANPASVGLRRGRFGALDYIEAHLTHQARARRVICRSARWSLRGHRRRP